MVKIGVKDQEIQKALDSLGKQAKTSGAELERLGSTPVGREALKSLDQIAVAMKAVTSAQQTLADRAVNAARGLELVGGVTKITSDELNSMARTVAKGLDAFRALGTDVPPELTKVSKAIQAQQAALKGASSEAGTLTTRMVAVGSAIGTFAGNLAADAFKRIGSAMIGVVTDAFKMNASLETTTLKFTTLIGDSDKAAAHVKDLFEIAKKTPFETGPIIEASLKLQTFGGAALNTKANILLLGDASAATGAPIQELGFWVGRMYAMLQGGKPFGEAALRLQELAVLSPQARDQMEAMQKSGKSAAEIFDVFKESLGGFTGAMVAQAGTWQGVMSTFTDTVNMMMADTLKPYFEVIRDLGKNVNVALDGMSSSLDDVAASTARTKQAFADFVTGSLSATIKAVSFVMVEFNALQVVFRDVMQVVQGVALAFEYAALGVAKLLNVASFGKAFNDDIKRINSSIDSLLVSISKRGAALQQDKQAEKDWIAWGDKATASVAAMTKGIGAASAAVSVHGGKVASAVIPTEKLADTTKKAAEAHEKLVAILPGVIPPLVSMAGAMQKIVDQKLVAVIPDITKHLEEMQSVLHPLNETALDFADVALPRVVSSLKAVGDAGATLGDALSKTFTGIPDILMKAFEGGGGLTGAVKSLAVKLGADFAKSLNDSITAAVGAGGNAFNKVTVKAAAATGAVAGLGVAMSGASGKASAATAALTGVSVAAGAIGTGATIGGAVALGAATAGIGLAAVGAYFAIKKMLKDPEKQINPIREQFVQLHGGLAALNVQAQAAGVSLTAMLNAKTPEAYNKAINDLNAALDSQAADVAALDEAIQRYGFSIEELGPAMQKQQLDAQAKTLLNDWRLLVESGIALTTVNAKMASSMNDYLVMARKTGQEVPSAMKPIIQSMIDQGLLLDENGVAITDMAQLGVAFSETMTQGFDRVVKKLAELLDKINGTVSGINNIPRDVTVRINYEDNGPPSPRDGDNRAATGGLVTRNGILHMARGGRILPFMPRGTDTVPAMLTPGERVLTVQETKAYDAGGVTMRGASVNTAGIEARLDLALEDSRRRDRMILKGIRDAVLIGRAG